MTDISNKLTARAKLLGLKPEDVKAQADAQILIRDTEDAGAVHVLVNPSAPLDAIEAKVPGLKLQVEDADPVDLGKAFGGEWKHFIISGLDKAPELAAAAERKVAVTLNAKGGAAGDGAEFTTIDLGFLVNMLRQPMEKAEPHLRGFAKRLPQTKFVEVSTELRKLVGAYVSQHVDDVVSVDVVNTVVAAHQKQNLAFIGALEGLSALGILPTFAPKAPQVAIDKSAPVAEGPLTEKATQWLAEQGITDLPEAHDADGWAAIYDQALDAGVPHDVAEELNRALIGAEDEAERAAAEGMAAFADFLADTDAEKASIVPTEPSLVMKNEGQASQARKFNFDRVNAGLKPFGLPDEVVRKAANVIHNATLQPSRMPAMVIVVGPSHSPADHVARLAEAMTFKGAIHVNGASDLGKSGFGPLFGHNNGAPTTQNAILSEQALDDARQGGRKVGIVIDDLFDVGRDDAEDARERTLVNWLLRLVDAMDTGRMSVFVDGAHTDVPLAETVFLQRARCNPDELLRIIDEHAEREPKLLRLKECIIALPGDPDQNLIALEIELQNELKTVDSPRVHLSDELKDRLHTLFSNDVSIEQVRTWMSEALQDASRTLPASSYTIEIKGRREGVTDKAKDRVFSGGFFGVGNPFKIVADVGSAQVALPFESEWRDVNDELAFYKNKASQLAKELAAHKKSKGD